MCKVIVIGNQKGGVGKTTTTSNLGIGLAKKGKKVLLIDADAQGSLTASLGFQEPDKLDVSLATIMANIINEEDMEPDYGILKHDEGVDLMPGNIELSGLEVSLVNVMSRELVLRTYIEQQKERYDYILIDCMPSLGMITINAFASADSILIPVQAAYLPVKGLEQLIKTIGKVKRQINPKLEIEGILLTMVDNRTNYATFNFIVIVTKNKTLIITVGIFALLLIMIMSALSSCGSMFTGTVTTTMASTYLSLPAEIDAADLSFTEKEMELQNKIDRIESDYPGYDEYDYNLGAIGHDPYTLISYLSAVHTEFTAEGMESEIQELFDAMYSLTTEEVEETRTRTVTKTGTRTVTNPDGTTHTEEYEYEEEEEYTVTILRVTLTVTPLESIVAGRMDSEQTEIFGAYTETKGGLQVFASPVDYYWYYYISSYYGYRKNPNTGAEELHRGVDIAVPTGTLVYAAHDGTVTEAAYDSYYGNYVVITDSKGYTTKYAHMDSLNVSAGQSIKKGDNIGKSGNTGSSTGSHLHIECLYNGVYYNPLFYFEAGEQTIYGETTGGTGGGTGNVIPPESYDDATVQTLMREANRYLGMPYTFGGTAPASFDCSGFVCWVFTNSGVHNLPRTTAQGIYDQCTPVSAADAKAGDIIFFTGTYNAGRPVTHVGIYCGNGTMVHCGDPIQYTSINTSYWQSHFYGFGRLN